MVEHGVQNHPPQNLQQAFATITDLRRDRPKHHELLDGLRLAVCCLLGGGSGFAHLVQFGRATLDGLRTSLAPPNGIPAHDTFRRVFALLDPPQFATACLTGTQHLRPAVGVEIVALAAKPCAAVSTAPRGVARSAGSAPGPAPTDWARPLGAGRATGRG